VTPRGFAGPNLLAMILFENFGQHQHRARRPTPEGYGPIAPLAFVMRKARCYSGLSFFRLQHRSNRSPSEL
jgi:hypothetical protein